MKPFAFVFPGQGSQSVGMVSQYHEVNPNVKTLFDRASDCIGVDLWEMVTQDANGQLNKTEFTQPCLLAAGVSAWDTWCQMTSARPNVLAGHSLGEYTALVCAKALAFEDAVKLVAKRGQLMQAAVPEGQGAMAAIVGLTDQQVQEICHGLQHEGVVSPANYNSIGQVVIAGEAHAVEQAIVQAKSIGAKLAVPIPVSVPSHCALMKPAAEQLSVVLGNMTLSTPEIDVINNVDVAIEQEPQQIKDALVRQMYLPVRWVELVQHMKSNHIEILAECGPGKVLSGLIKRIDRSIAIHTLNHSESMQSFIDQYIENQ